MSSLASRLHKYLADHPVELGADLVNSVAESRRQNITWEQQRSIDHIPVPYLLARSRYDALCHNARHVHAALERVVHGYRTDPQIRDYFSHLAKLERFLSLPSTASTIPIARFDIVESRSGQFQVCEPNTCCPGGAIWTSQFYDIFRQSSVYRYLTGIAREVPQPIQSGDTIYRYLISEYDHTFGPRADYNIVIADTRSAPMTTELYELRDAARQRGHRAEVAQIQDLTYDGRELRLGDMRVDILYQFLDVLFTDDLAQIAASYEEIAPYLRALEDRAALVVNPFGPILISEDKSILALLHDPAFASLFTPQERAAIDAIVPPTYRMRPGPVRFEGETADLATLLRSRKDDFLIKAQMESMGRNITIGRTLAQAEWDAAIDRTMDGMYVAQRFVEETPLQLPVPGRTPVETVPMNYTLALTIYGGEPVGMYNRSSPALVTNVCQGGAVGEVFVYEDRGDAWR